MRKTTIQTVNQILANLRQEKEGLERCIEAMEALRRTQEGERRLLHKPRNPSGEADLSDGPAHS